MTQVNKGPSNYPEGPETSCCITGFRFPDRLGEEMRVHSAGILLYRPGREGLQVLLAHPGGPFWARKDDGAWSIPKGEVEGDEDLLAAARREFREETGLDVDGPFIGLGKLRQPSGKIVHCWALDQDLDPADVRSNSFTMEWPRGSGNAAEFPEVDRVQWFTLREAKQKILTGQREFIDRLAEKIAAP